MANQITLNTNGLLSSIAVATVLLVRFGTRFEHEAAALESVTPVPEKDGSRRVSACFTG